MTIFFGKTMMNNLLKLIFALFAVTSFSVGHATDAGLGASDVIRVSVFNNPDLSIETRISGAGTIFYPLLGEVSVSGLTPVAASKKIAGLLQEGGFIRNAQVNIIVTDMQSHLISVLGHVNKPGRYPVDGNRTVTDILALAGGIHPEGGDIITLVRKKVGESKKELIYLDNLFRAADVDANVAVAAGDVVFVERAPRFYIYGEVQRPGAYRLEKDMNVMQALSVGGGLTPRGTERGMRVKRRNTSGELDMLRVGHDDVLKPDDVVYVQESLF